ncbi:pyridoxal-phosphate dependent enzyme [Paraliomyxa miuraensis]|uniref:pyridoxal-phosphate dependent enzyme n=1 Tax=Paraliomyxa miuraensis TaxID=376150 RepID=UPI00224F5315|nr:pyridoxal-phosphate dependent enzyme [Paraliomyxa miuraensis]MCX4244762.1 pyridoxal-phosphate dependent enzyme [Paraliomyxa miuraensis]
MKVLEGGGPSPAVWLECSGCGRQVALTERLPFVCPAARSDDDVDHVLVRRIDPARLRFPESIEGNPFVVFGRLLSHSHRAAALGVDDVELRALVEGLDAAVSEIDGTGFRPTPLRSAVSLSSHMSGPAFELWLKDETDNVSGSHKARHLMGVMIHLRLAEVAGLFPPAALRSRLAIASCGNAALAAAVVARAVRWPLDVFVPPDADADVLERLIQLEAAITSCVRDGSPGDPCYRAFRDALARGALPFGVQGSDNGLAVEGGLTLGYELADQVRRGPGRLDLLVVQVGGGALASACMQALRDAVSLGVLPKVPRLCTVQTASAWPLRRAYELVVRAIATRLGEVPPADPRLRADWLRHRVPAELVDEALRHAATHRRDHMWPWESTPRSVAHGILDDETYDWWALCEGMIRSGGWPVVVDEPTLVEAREAVRRRVQVDATATGTAGVAGVMHMHRSGRVFGGEIVGALVTGRAR